MKPYTVTQLNPDTYMIAEVYHQPAALPMYLVVGTRRAALIDTGMGIGNLPGTVSELTNLPVTVYNTHAHLDHKNKAAFCGDSVNPRVGIRLSLTRYANALDRMLASTDEIERYYTGHRLFPFCRQDVQDLRACAREIIDGAPGEPYPAIFSRKGPSWAWIHWHNGKRIVFDKAKIQ